MKMLSKIKMCVIGALFLGTMSSCLKSEEPEFGVYQYQFYIIQSTIGEGESAIKRFQPYVKAVFNEPVAKTPTLRSASGNIISLKQIQSNFYVSELSYTQPFSSLPLENYVLQGVNAEGEVATAEIPLSMATLADTLGAINVSDWKYDGTTISFKVNEVKNAAAYWLIVSANGVRSEISFNRVDNLNKMEINHYLEHKQPYDIRIAALSKKGVLVESESLHIVVGKETEAPTGPTEEVQ